MIYYLIYKSKRSENSDNQTIRDILNVSKVNNKEYEITGSLVHNEDTFVQYIEGKKKNVLETFNRIKSDKRHHSINLLDFGVRELRLFPDWAMLNNLQENIYEINGDLSVDDIMDIQVLFSEDFYFDIEDNGLNDEIKLIKKALKE